MARGIYLGACALTVGDGGWAVLFPKRSGIMQGCPLSDSLYATVMDPPLRAMADGLETTESGTARACADDVGAALAALSSLRAFRRPFHLVAGGIGLVLRPDKCRLVTLAGWTDPQTVHRIRRWLSDNIPEWTELSGIPDRAVCRCGAVAGTDTQVAVQGRRDR